MYLLGLTTMGESSAALLKDGEIIACAERAALRRGSARRDGGGVMPSVAR